MKMVFTVSIGELEYGININKRARAMLSANIFDLYNYFILKIYNYFRIVEGVKV